LSEAERWKNVSDAFLANPQIIKGRSILIIDDVSTTGATMNAAASAARTAGAKLIYCLTLARTFRGFDRTIQT
jgi:predicted amidophosphoribosyltransferase